MRPTFSTLAAGLAMASAFASVPASPALADGSKLQMFGLTADQHLIRFREDRARNIKAPVLLMGGWYDPFLPTQIRDFQTIRREAAEWAVTRGSRSGRVAWQFIQDLAGRHGVRLG